MPHLGGSSISSPSLHSPLPRAVTFGTGRTHLTVCSERFASGLGSCGAVSQLLLVTPGLPSPSQSLSQWQLAEDESHQRLVALRARVKDPHRASQFSHLVCSFYVSSDFIRAKHSKFLMLFYPPRCLSFLSVAIADFDKTFEGSPG